MLNKLPFQFQFQLQSQFRVLKKLCTPFSFANSTKVPLFPHQHHPFQKTLNFHQISNYSSYKEDVYRLDNLSFEQKSKMRRVMDKYATHKEDFTQLTPEDIQWMLSGLSDLSLALEKARNPYKAKDCLADRAFILQKLGLKDTIEAALNYYQMALIVISQELYAPRRTSDKAEEYLDEVDRICKLLGEDPQAISLKVQRWFVLAQIESETSQDKKKALELYNAVLENIGDIDESALPMILPNLYQEMGKIYREKGDTDNMIKSYENALQAVIKYYGEKSTIDFTFLGDIAKDEQSAENRLKMVLERFPDPHEKAAVVCCLIGNIYLANQNIQAVSSYHEAFQIFEKLSKDYSSLLYDVYFSMANAMAMDIMITYQYKHRYKECPDFLKKAEETLLKANGGEPNLKVAAVFCRWATSLKGFDPFAAFGISYSYHSKALELYKTLDPSNKAKIFSIYRALGRIDLFAEHMTFNQYDEANWEKPLETWKEAEKYIDPTDHSSVLEVSMSLRSIYSHLENREESEKYLQKMLQSCEATGDTFSTFSVYAQDGEYYEKIEKWKEALENYDIAARVYDKDAKKDPAKAQNLAAKISQIKEKLQML